MHASFVYRVGRPTYKRAVGNHQAALVDDQGTTTIGGKGAAREGGHAPRHCLDVDSLLQRQGES